MSSDRFGDYSHLRRRPSRFGIRIVPPHRAMTTPRHAEIVDEAAPVPPAMVELIVPGLAGGASVIPAPVEAQVVKERRYPIVGVDWGDGYEPGPVS